MGRSEVGRGKGAQLGDDDEDEAFSFLPGCSAESCHVLILSGEFAKDIVKSLSLFGRADHTVRHT